MIDDTRREIEKDNQEDFRAKQDSERNYGSYTFDAANPNVGGNWNYAFKGTP